jgi:acetoin utilization deacetylase AcuC-like enzyme
LRNTKDLRPTGYQPGYRDYMNGIIGNGCAVDMETATKNHLTLSFYNWCSKYIQKLYPKLSKGDVYYIMKGIYEEKYSGNNQIVLDFRKLLRDQAPTDRVIEKNPTNVLKVYKDIL